jgi:hypothetical protein
MEKDRQQEGEQEIIEYNDNGSYQLKSIRDTYQQK